MTKKLSLILLIISLSGLWFWQISFQRQRFYKALLADSSPAKTTAPKAFKIAAVGDIACTPAMAVSSSTCRMKAVADAIREANVDMVLLLGDLQYDSGEAANFAKVFGVVWGGLLPKSYAVPGNHEYQTPQAAGYFDFWDSVDSSKRGGERGKGYYSLDAGGWHLVALNSNCEHIGGCGPGSTQGQWLEQDLSKNKTTCSLAFWHHPHFSSGRYRDDESSFDRSASFWQVLYKAKAEVILNGHDHIYERFTKQRADGQPDAKSGVRQFTVGTGGRSLYKLSGQKLPTHEAGDDDHFGFLQLNLYPYGYSWEFKSIDGGVIDSGSSNCQD